MRGELVGQGEGVEDSKADLARGRGYNSVGGSRHVLVQGAWHALWGVLSCGESSCWKGAREVGWGVGGGAGWMVGRWVLLL